MTDACPDAAVDPVHVNHWSRHPLLVGLIGFVLTAIVGTTITFLYNRLNADREHAGARLAARRAAIMETHRALFEYQGTVLHLETEINLRMPNDALLEAFKLYQGAAARAYAAIPGAEYVLYQQGGGIGTEVASRNVAQSMVDFESAVTDVVDNRLMPLLKYTDSCVSSRYANLIAKGTAAASDDCGDRAELEAAYPRMPRNLTDRLQAYGECSEAFTSIMIALGTDPDETLWSAGSRRLFRMRGFHSQPELISSCPQRHGDFSNHAWTFNG
ncbi:hypothetical protein M3I54_41000 [Paraburkholderia sp. CNPSo 3274]|uniref:hypothetical protein n=1 Tax=Paraburkholderia sp. CNPSo 3274 TaxID=2940932 RepID=UPI0020B8ED7F|nr:hypothetical protein [Paraburkholderia sp. CNPSo 3274]MCP3713179.1 hypothetical protein [Paraburkholderia sp. CNPSo 3274]